MPLPLPPVEIEIVRETLKRAAISQTPLVIPNSIVESLIASIDNLNMVIAGLMKEMSLVSH